MRNYFDVLELRIEEIKGKDEPTIKSIVTAAHRRLYALALDPIRKDIPRLDGLNQQQWQTILNEAKKTLIDPQKRLEHIATINSASMPETRTDNMKWKKWLIVISLIIIAIIGISKIINNTPPPAPGAFGIIFKAAPQAKVYYMENQRKIFIGRTMLVLTPKDIKELRIQEGTKFILERSGNNPKQYIHPNDGERADSDDMISYTYKWY